MDGRTEQLKTDRIRVLFGQYLPDFWQIMNETLLLEVLGVTLLCW